MRAGHLKLVHRRHHLMRLVLVLHLRLVLHLLPLPQGPTGGGLGLIAQEAQEEAQAQVEKEEAG